MKKVTKEIVQFAEFRALLWVSRIFYVAGLTALIPLVPLVLAPEELFRVRTALSIAIAFILISFFLVFWFTKSKRESLQALGFMTLIPGLVAVVFAFAGDRPLIAIMQYLGKASPFIQSWLESYVPRSWVLAGIYILVGTGLLYASQNVRR